MPLVAAAAVAAGAALQSATGFGFSLIAAPLLFAALGPREAIGLMVVLGLEVNLLTLFTERRRPQPLVRECAVLLGWAVPGALVGVAVLRSLDEVALQVAVSVGVVATLAARRLTTGRHTPRWAAPLAGFASGALTTSTTTSGPPLLVYLLGRGVEPERMRDTLTACFLGLSPVGVFALWITDTRGVIPEASLVALCVPLAAAGHLLGRPLFARLARGRRYEPVLTGVLLVSIVAGLASATL
jgi:uncharacterized membrane protein YfcA